MPTPSPDLVRAARALLGLSQADIARRAGVPVRAVQRTEARDTVPEEVVERISAALEKAGVTFLADDGSGPGLRLRRRRRARQSIPVEELTAENDE